MQDTPIVIDCDTGRDDALTIWTALSSKLNTELCAVITSYGNVSVDQVTDNTIKVLGIAGRNDIPVIKGAHAPINDNHIGYTETTVPRQKTSGNGICNVVLPETSRTTPQNSSPSKLAESIISLSDKHGSLDYYIIGPATNFASICRELGPNIHNVVNRVVMMGGKLEPMWSSMPGADFNLICDPFAVDEILRTNIPFTFVPMNTTWPMNIHLNEVQGLSARTDLSSMAKKLMIAYCQDFAPDSIFRFHDPTVLFESISKDNHEKRKLGININEDDADFGRLDENLDKTYDVKVFLPDEELRSHILSQTLEALGLERS